MESLQEQKGWTQEERVRYARHAVLPGFGWAGQEKLRASKVLVVGAGGLGAPLLQYLTAAGIGRIGIADPDRVSLSNLQRQVLFSVEDIGVLKVDAAARRLSKLNPNVQFDLYPYAITRENALELLAHYDLVADGSDNFSTRYLVNDACVLLGKPLVYASVFRYEGQLSVFNYTHPNGRKGPNYRNLFPVPPEAGSVPSCVEGGVLGVLPGILGCMQANEVLKIASGIGEPLSGKLCLFDAYSLSQRIISLPDQDPYPVTELEDYEASCGPIPGETPEISCAQFAKWQAEEKIILQLIDVREPWEYEQENIGGTLIPLASLPEKAVALSFDLPTVVVCQSGFRSAAAVRILQEQFGFSEVYNLTGGIDAFRRGTRS
ncbi:MAG: molybdopterin-synthase adenylyltransferase MoeB [Haliscomenobacter sp.]|nr:molybdopterin-synthase adenylyltransferase MoeB [Haliscomenobacter sp.]MBP9872772.1 molybdopterin-synthase adenylyltransferase MoeB [Haliscomenobacter sp.]